MDNCYNIKRNGSKAALIHFVEPIVNEMANMVWLQVDVAEENKEDGKEINLHQYVDLAQGDNLTMTKNMLRNAHSQCENLLEGLLLPFDADFLTMDNMHSEEECYTTEIRVPAHMRPSDVELIAYTMHYYMIHYALAKWAATVAPQYREYWVEEMQADAAKLDAMNKKRNRVVTERKGLVL